MRGEVIFKPVTHESWCPKSNRAGVVLAIIVNEIKDIKLARKVNQQAANIAATFKHLSLINNQGIKESLSLLYLNEVKRVIDKRTYPHNVADHLWGMTKTIYREKIFGPKLKRIEDARNRRGE